MSRQLLFNKLCLVRNQDCKRVFEGSRLCFIACPNSEDIALELDIIKEKLREENVEPYIAVDNREFQKDIFCEKICAKIIESLFCIVILNDVVPPGRDETQPNANVYYEYGLITALRKKIIPIQKNDQQLAFNIQSLDTLKYSRKSFSNEIHDAIKMILFNIEKEQKDEEKDLNTPSKIIWCLDFMGLTKQERRLSTRITEIVRGGTPFEIYLKPNDDSRLHFVGLFSNDIKENDLLFFAKVINKRVINLISQIQNELIEVDEVRRPMAYIEDKKRDLESLIYQLKRSKILILKPDQNNIEQLIERYHSVCEEIELKLDFDVINETKAIQILK